MDKFNNNDPLKHFVKGKLANYKQEVPPNNWDRIEQTLFATQKTKVVYTKWFRSTIAVAAAAALIGVFFMIQNTNNVSPLQTAENKTEYKSTTNQKKEKPLISKQHPIKIKETTPPLYADNSSSIEQKTSVSLKKEEEQKLLITSNNIPHKEEQEEVASSSELSKEKKESTDLDEETKQQMLQDFINEGKRTTYITEEKKTTKKKTKYGISLSGRSSFSGSQQSNLVPTTLRASLDESYGSYTMGKMQASNEEENVSAKSETNHNQPISFGVLTSFNVTPKLQIETGLIYTYLSSETTNKAQGFINSEKVQFHYLGVPVNLNYTLLSVNKLNIFVTAGAMIEKDINGKIKYNEEKNIASEMNSGYTNEGSSKINQENPQFSLAGGVGINYPIYNKTNLFAKIGGRYYINANNEYKTYYSDEKFGLDIQLGIKFNF